MSLVMINNGLIDRLPVETVSNIFLLAIRPSRPKYHRTTSALAKLTAIAAVSKRWMSVVDAAPELWSFLHSSDPIKITLMALEKSKDASLTITCILHPKSKTDDEPATLRFINCVVPYVARWRFAYFRVNATVLSRIPTAAAPRLYSLRLQCQDNHVMLDNPFGGQAPRLRELACVRAAVRWTSGFLAGLSSLKILLIRNEQLCIRCSELYATLANCPNLQSLDITQGTKRAADPLVLGEVPILHFPYLTEIKLSMPSAFNNTILSHIEAPACSTFMAEAEVGMVELLDRLIPYLPKVINNRPLERWNAEIYVEEERMRFTLAPVHRTFTLWRPFDLELVGEWLPTFTWIIDKLLLSTTIQFPMTLHFSINCQFSESLLESTLLRLPRVQHLIVEHSVNPERVWGWLAKPAQHSGTSQWLFPQLRKIEIYGDHKYDWDSLVATVRSRWGPDHDRELDQPHFLETLRYIASDLTEEQVKSLKEVIGDENVMSDPSDYGTDSAESDVQEDFSF